MTLSESNTLSCKKSDTILNHFPLENKKLFYSFSNAFWIEDIFVSQCRNCNASFNVLCRRHHCRMCGQIFCKGCLLSNSSFDNLSNSKLYTKQEPSTLATNSSKDSSSSYVKNFKAFHATFQHVLDSSKNFTEAFINSKSEYWFSAYIKVCRQCWNDLQQQNQEVYENYYYRREYYFPETSSSNPLLTLYAEDEEKFFRMKSFQSYPSTSTSLNLVSLPPVSSPPSLENLVTKHLRRLAEIYSTSSEQHIELGLPDSPNEILSSIFNFRGGYDCLSPSNAWSDYASLSLPILPHNSTSSSPSEVAQRSILNAMYMLISSIVKKMFQEIPFLEKVTPMVMDIDSLNPLHASSPPFLPSLASDSSTDIMSSPLDSLNAWAKIFWSLALCVISRSYKPGGDDVDPLTILSCPPNSCKKPFPSLTWIPGLALWLVAPPSIRMPRVISKPRILFLCGDIGHITPISDSVKYRYTNTGVLQQLVRRLECWSPSVILVEGSIHHALRRTLMSPPFSGVLLVPFIGREKLRHLAWCCGGRLIEDLSYVTTTRLTGLSPIGKCRCLKLHHYDDKWLVTFIDTPIIPTSTVLICPGNHHYDALTPFPLSIQQKSTVSIISMALSKSCALAQYAQWLLSIHNLFNHSFEDNVVTVDDETWGEKILSSVMGKNMLQCIQLEILQKHPPTSANDSALLKSVDSVYVKTLRLWDELNREEEKSLTKKHQPIVDKGKLSSSTFRMDSVSQVFIRTTDSVSTILPPPLLLPSWSHYPFACISKDAMLAKVPITYVDGGSTCMIDFFLWALTQAEVRYVFVDSGHLWRIHSLESEHINVSVDKELWHQIFKLSSDSNPEVFTKTAAHQAKWMKHRWWIWRDAALAPIASDPCNKYIVSSSTAALITLETQGISKNESKDSTANSSIANALPPTSRTSSLSRQQMNSPISTPTISQASSPLASSLIVPKSSLPIGCFLDETIPILFFYQCHRCGRELSHPVPLSPIFFRMPVSALLRGLILLTTGLKCGHDLTSSGFEYFFVCYASLFFVPPSMSSSSRDRLFSRQIFCDDPIANNEGFVGNDFSVSMIPIDNPTPKRAVCIACRVEKLQHALIRTPSLYFAVQSNDLSSSSSPHEVRVFSEQTVNEVDQNVKKMENRTSDQSQSDDSFSSESSSFISCQDSLFSKDVRELLGEIGNLVRLRILPHVMGARDGTNAIEFPDSDPELENFLDELKKLERESFKTQSYNSRCDLKKSIFPILDLTYRIGRRYANKDDATHFTRLISSVWTPSMFLCDDVVSIVRTDDPVSIFAASFDLLMNSVSQSLILDLESGTSSKLTSIRRLEACGNGMGSAEEKISLTGQYWSEATCRAGTVSVRFLFPHAFEAVQNLVCTTKEGNEKSHIFIESFLHSQPFIPQAGKSKAVFFITSDSRYIIKQVKTVEWNHFLVWGRKYFQHLGEIYHGSYLNEEDDNFCHHSTLAKPLAMFSIQERRKWYFTESQVSDPHYYVVMENLGFQLQPLSIYDWKGTPHTRSATEGSSVFLDSDYIREFKEGNIRFCDPGSKAAFMKTLARDTEMLASAGIMDYSLVVMIIAVKDDDKSIKRTSEAENSAAFYMHVGLVDYLQPYNGAKAIESKVKAGIGTVRGNIVDGPTIIDPASYRFRFLSRIEEYLICVLDSNL